MKDNYCINDLLDDMDEIFKRFLFSRSMTPYIKADEWNNEARQQQIRFNTAELYKYLGFKCEICINTDNMGYEDWLATGDWINKSFFVHIYALLDNLCIVKYVDECLCSKADREKDIWNLFKHMRNAFSHSEKYTEKLKDRTYNNYQSAYKLQKKLYPLICDEEKKLNMSIDKFIIPFYPELRNVFINHLSEFESFNYNKEGKFVGVKKSG